MTSGFRLPRKKIASIIIITLSEARSSKFPFHESSLQHCSFLEPTLKSTNKLIRILPPLLYLFCSKNVIFFKTKFHKHFRDESFGETFSQASVCSKDTCAVVVRG